MRITSGSTRGHVLHMIFFIYISEVVERLKFNEILYTCRLRLTQPRKSSCPPEPERADWATCLKKRAMPRTPFTSFSLLTASSTGRLVVMVPGGGEGGGGLVVMVPGGGDGKGEG